jgi:ATP-dependent 26S proteasome regulatory subunit
MTKSRRKLPQSSMQDRAHAGQQALASALRCLDALLGVAVEQQARRLGPASLMDPWLGMHLEQAEVQRLLAEAPHRALGADDGAAGLLAGAMREVPGLPAMCAALQLQDLDLAALLIALAPDLDLRYERIYGFLQDDITHHRPSLDLMANLLAVDAAQRMALCARFACRAPLRLHGMLAGVHEHPRSPLAQDWRVDPVWRAWLTQGGIADAIERPARATVPPAPETPVLDPATGLLLDQACELAAAVPLRLWLHGEHGTGKFDTARAVARRLQRELLPIDLREAESAGELLELVGRAGRAACLFGGLLYIYGVGSLAQRDAQLTRALLAALAMAPCHVVVASLAPPPPVHADALPLIRIAMPYPDVAARHLLWRRAMQRGGADVPDDDLATLAARFSVTSHQIFQAAAEAELLALVQHGGPPTSAELAAAVRLQCGGELARMATRIDPRADFSSLVAPGEVRAQLREICARVGTRDTVAQEWAQDSVHARATGVTALFVGPSGTGKTLSAEAVARELGLDLYRIDLAGIVSKYIGETEKNLDRVFDAAAHANAVLFFDEADALFGKRSEVKDAHDRYANIEVAYLLQKMEQFDGLAILATNLRQNIDEAFARRLTFTVNFPFPEEPERRQLWESLWPPRAPRADDVDLAWFAREYRLSGGNIRNAVMAAAHLAAADGLAVTRAHLLHATRREFQKLGKNLAQPAGAAS